MKRVGLFEHCDLAEIGPSLCKMYDRFTQTMQLHIDINQSRAYVINFAIHSVM